MKAWRQGLSAAADVEAIVDVPVASVRKMLSLVMVRSDSFVCALLCLAMVIALSANVSFVGVGDRQCMGLGDGVVVVLQSARSL